MPIFFNSKYYSTIETEQDPVGLLGMEAFPCPPFLVCREQTPASITFPESKREIQTVANKGRQWMQRQGKSNQETIVQPWGRVLVPQGIHTIIRSLRSSGTKAPTRVEDGKIMLTLLISVNESLGTVTFAPILG